LKPAREIGRPVSRATRTSPDNLDRHLPVPGEALSSGAVETEHAG
jgi:hypothetical protein